MNKILLVDGHSILNRAFYGLPDMTNSKGQHTNAVLGFLNIVFKVIDEEKPTHMVVAFDVKEPTFRHIKYEQYKGTRKPMPAELHEQVPMIKDVLNSMNITVIEKGGYEADDIIGTMSKRSEELDFKVVVLSGDRDLLQLATSNILIKIPKTKTGGTVMENYYDIDVKKKYGVTPIEFIDLKGLMGDQSDNIPGVPGIGEKTASKIIIEYGSIENAINHIDEIKPNKARENLQEFNQQAILSKELATIKLDCDLDVTQDETIIENMFNNNSYNIFKEFEFKSLLNKYEFKVGEEQKQEVTVNKIVVDDFSEYNKLIESFSTKSEIGVNLILGEDRTLLGASFSDKEDVSYIVPVRNFISDELIISSIMELEAKNTKIILIDLKEYLPYLKFNENSNVFDCQVAAYLLNPMKESYGYDDLARDYLTMSLPSKVELVGKSYPTIFSFEDEKFLDLFAFSSFVSLKAYKVLVSKLEDTQMLELYNNIELPCIFSLYDMEKNGVRVDKDALREYGQGLTVRINQLVSDIYKYAEEEFNINSTIQLGTILFDKLGLTSGKKTKKGYSTGADVLEKIRNEHPIIPCILEYRQLTKLNSTYVEGLSNYIKEDGRIHGKFNQTVTATGRISSTEPNLQNIPMRTPLGREIRRIFIPKDDYVFVDADYSQIELRVLAHVSKDETLIEAYNNHSDIHAITASEVFDIHIDQVDDLMRRQAKAVNFGIVYGISSFGLGQDLNISRKEAEKYINKYFETYPSIKTYLDENVSRAKEQGYVSTIFGRRRPVLELKSSNFMTRAFGERIAMNSPIQGAAADIIKIAMINVNKELKERQLKSKLLLQIHDELLIEAHKSELDIVVEIVKRCMEEAAKLSVKLEIDIHTGINWLEAK